ncbi:MULTISPECIES: MurR/RpiR family transcriptional regulator [unclassified Lactobacillus]|uniref:MurR/RpiR family transcriptional regulator n=1 Tax=unclassified Lactobacillus TaxID=2620435 RepID=UPI0022406E67|nr:MULTISPECIES: hypothetical protein [unclassified Lactobacillus]
MQEILNMIYQELGTLPAEDQKIARVILANPSKVAEMNLSEFAQFLQVSESTVTEFCEKLGLSSFVQLREQLGNKNLMNKGSISKVFNDLPTFEKDNLVSIFRDAALVQIVGASEKLQDKIIELLNKNGIFALGVANPKISLAQTLHLKSKDVLLVIEPEEISFELVKQVQIAKHEGVKIVTLGRELGRRVGMEADCFIDCQKEKVINVLEAIITNVLDSDLKLQNFKKKYRDILKSRLS